MRLWPFTLEHIVYLWNLLTNGRMGISPIEIYTSNKLDLSCLKNEHTWGYAVYILDLRLQDGKQIPKWQPKTSQGQYLGKSVKHASPVGLIRNLQIGYISPQFYIRYDTLFQTVMGGYGSNDAVSDHIWIHL